MHTNCEGIENEVNGKYPYILLHFISIAMHCISYILIANMVCKVVNSKGTIDKIQPYQQLKISYTKCI